MHTIIRPFHLRNSARAPIFCDSVPPSKITARDRIPATAAKEYLRVSRVAKRLDVSPKYIYQLLSEGRLECVRLGPRQVRIPTDSLERFLKSLPSDLSNLS